MQDSLRSVICNSVESPEFFYILCVCVCVYMHKPIYIYIYVYTHIIKLRKIQETLRYYKSQFLYYLYIYIASMHSS